MIPTLPVVYAPPPHATFDDATHTYRVRQLVLPSVTQVIYEQGFMNFDEVPRHQLERAQERGTRVHRAIHYHLDRDLAQGSVWPEEMGYLESAARYLEQTRITPVQDLDGTTIGVESRFWNVDYFFGGTVDLVGFDADGTLSITDWKTGEPSDVAAPIQTAAYEIGVRAALLAQLPPKHPARLQPIRRRAVKLFKTGNMGRVYTSADHRDGSLFLQALSCTHFRRNGCKHETPMTRELRMLYGH